MSATVLSSPWCRLLAMIWSSILTRLFNCRLLMALSSTRFGLSGVFSTPGVDNVTTGPEEADQVHTAVAGFADGESGRRRDRCQGADANAGALLHHLEAGTAGDQGEAVGKRLAPTLPEARTDQFIQRVVAANIFPHQYNIAFGIAPGRPVGGACLHLQRLMFFQVMQGVLNHLVCRHWLCCHCR